MACGTIIRALPVEEKRLWAWVSWTEDGFVMLLGVILEATNA